METHRDRSGLQAPHPLGELCVHHEVVHVFLSLGEFQLPSHDGHHECSAACSLCVAGGHVRIPTPGLPPPGSPPNVPALCDSRRGTREVTQERGRALCHSETGSLQHPRGAIRSWRQVLRPGIVATECRDHHDEPVSTLVGIKVFKDPEASFWEKPH